jgi:glucose/arabinose dehydrogenase
MTMMSSLCTASPLENAVLAPGFCAATIPISVNQPRSIRNVKVTVVEQAPTSNITTTMDVLLVLERGSQSVITLRENEEGIWSRNTVILRNGLNHGLEFTAGTGEEGVDDFYLYASSSTTVFRWKMNGSNMTALTPADPELVIINMNADGQGGAPFGHQTRTLAFDESNKLYVSIGSAQNVDADSYRSRIRRFEISASETVFPIDFETGQVFADGLRNEVGMAFDKHGALWGVENSADQLTRSDLGGRALTQNNPAEELNRFTEETLGSHYGYPYCFTEYRLPDSVNANVAADGGRGAAWAWPSFLANGVVTDDMCRSQEDYVPPAVAMQGHSAPLGITFYKWTAPENRPDHCANVMAFPQAMDGFAFIAFHGSWNRDIPTGYKVVYVPMDESGNVPAVTEPQVFDLLAHTPPDAQWQDGFRPVDVEFDSCGRLVVSSDGSRRNGVYEGSKLVRIESTSMDFITPNTDDGTFIYICSSLPPLDRDVGFQGVYCSAVVALYENGSVFGRDTITDYLLDRHSLTSTFFHFISHYDRPAEHGQWCRSSSLVASLE